MMWVTADFIQRHHHLTLGHIYKLASVDKWRRRKTWSGTEYNGDDVRTTLDRLDKTRRSK